MISAPRVRATLTRTSVLLIVLGILASLVLTALGAVRAVPVAAVPAPSGYTSDPDSSAEASGPARKLVVVGAAGLSLADLDPATTPHLWTLASLGATANLSVRSITAATCPASGWLTLGAGARAEARNLPTSDAEGTEAAEASAACPMMREPSPQVIKDSPVERDGNEDTGADTEPAPHTWAIKDFGNLQDVNDATGYKAQLGGMTAGITDEQCTAAIGAGAGYGLADPSGSVENYAPAGTPVADVPDCALTMVDLGAVGEHGWISGIDETPEGNEGYPGDEAIDVDADEAAARVSAAIGTEVPADRAEQVAELDETLGASLDGVDLDTTDVLVVGLADSSSTPALRALIAAGPSYEPGRLSSTSTRQPSTVQLTDIASASMRDVEGLVPGDTVAPSEFRVTPDPDEVITDVTPLSDPVTVERIDGQVAAATKASTVKKAAQPVSVTLDVVVYVFAIAAGIVLSIGVARSKAGGRARRWLSISAHVAAAVPIGTFLSNLLPWERVPGPGLGLVAAILLMTALVLGVSLLGPWRRTAAGRVLAMCVFAALVLAADIMTGSRLQFNAPLGYNAIVAGRFYGLGNQGAALFIVAIFTAMGIALSLLSRRLRVRWLLLVTAVVGAGAVVVLGNPSWGAKFGGTIATLAGFAVLFLLVAGVRLRWWKLLLVGAGSLLVILGFAWLDYQKPPAERSHFGVFFGQIVSGEMWQVLGRKLEANLHIFVINPPLAIVTPVAAIAVLFFLAYLARFRSTRALTRPWTGRLPEVMADRYVHAGFLSVVVGLTVGLMITDSGIAVPSTGAMMLLPLLVVLSEPVLREPALAPPPEVPTA